MPDVLDEDLTDLAGAYLLFVDRADEFTEVVRNWYVKYSGGTQPMRHDFHHIFWRVIAERHVWGTLRNALQTTWPRADQPGPGPLPPPRPPPAPPPVPPPTASGAGILEHATSTAVRPRLTGAQVAAFLPSEPGPFVFPGYGTRGIRLTSARDGSVHPLGMSYWPNINAHSGLPSLFVLLSINGMLSVLDVDKATGAVSMLQILPVASTGEGCYWSLSHPALVYVPSGNRLIFYDVTTGQSGDAAAAYGEMRQCHSSYDGQVHSFALNGNAAVSMNGEVRLFPSPFGGLDECQVTKSGEYLLIKERGPDSRDANRVVHLPSGREWTTTDAQGALGHSDCGWDYAIGEEDQTNPGGVFRLWRYTPDGTVDEGVKYHVGGWGAMTRYVSHCHAPRAGLGRQAALFSGSTEDDRPRANELVMAGLDGSLACRVLCPNLNDLGAEDGYGADNKYWRKTRANLCPAGEFAAFTGNAGTNRVDAFLVEV